MTTKKAIQTEEHHRRPCSLGGPNNPTNISYVPPKLHRAWHILFGNMNAEQICNKINYSPIKPKGKTVVCKFINGKEVIGRGENNSKKNLKCKDAWETLFAEFTFEELIQYINNTWLDPSYHFYIVE